MHQEGKLEPLSIAKFGGSALGVDGANIPTILKRIRELREEGKVVAVFSAPLSTLRDASRSLTDITIALGNSCILSAESPSTRFRNSPLPAEANGRQRTVLGEVAPPGTDPSILLQPFEFIAAEFMTEAIRKEFDGLLKAFHAQVLSCLKDVAEYMRFDGALRARALAYSGELLTACAMDHVLRSQGLRSAHLDFREWPIITDDSFEMASFLLEESKAAARPLLDLVKSYDVVSIGGFIGKTLDGFETTFERGGSDRTAIDLALLLNSHYDVKVHFEKNNVVLSADPRIERRSLEHVTHLTYNEARLAGQFGMQILDPLAIDEIISNNLDIPLVIRNMDEPSRVTLIERTPHVTPKNPLKIVVGKRNCALVRMEGQAASHMMVSLKRTKNYREFVPLSEYAALGSQRARILFTDATYVRKQEKYIAAYDDNAEFIYERGVVTLIGDDMWQVPSIVSMATGALGENDVRIVSMDVQEETSRIIFVLEDTNDNVATAVRAIHAKRPQVRARAEELRLMRRLAAE
jgi:aspartate kinase